MANIVDNLLGILGSKKDASGKKGKYFLELNESEDPKPSQVAAKVEAAASQVKEKVSQAADSVKPQVEAAASEVKEKVSQAVDSVKPQVEAAASEVKEKVSQAVESVKPQAEAGKDKEKKSKRTSVKDRATKKQEAKSALAPTVDPKPAAPIPQPAKPAASEIKTFAPNYLNVSFVTSSRRRPGPSLNTFKNMAKDVGPRR
jgi:NADH dehydrogenase/NADH:ubiquinone oxidoreductase subunit G